MSAKLVFLRRTAEETALQGGEVYFDINGRNIGKLASTDCFAELPAGKYQLRMYKSHNYGTMIGFAETTVEVNDGDSLLIRYTPPIVVSQPGYLMVSRYSPEAADTAAEEPRRQIVSEHTKAEEKRAQSQRGTRRAVKWIIWGSVATGSLIALFWILYFLIWEALIF